MTVKNGRMSTKNLFMLFRVILSYFSCSSVSLQDFKISFELNVYFSFKTTRWGSVKLKISDYLNLTQMQKLFGYSSMKPIFFLRF
jgi:hypothetical protein